MKPGTLSLDSIFHIAARQTGAVFSYDANRLDVRQRVRITTGVTTLEKLLVMLTNVNGLCIKRLETHIIVAQCLKSSGTIVQGNISKTKQKVVKPARQDSRLEYVQRLSSKNDTVVNIDARNPASVTGSPIDSVSLSKDTLRTRSTIRETPIVSQSSPMLSDSVAAEMGAKHAADKQRVPQPSSKPKSNSRQSNLFARVGVSLDESRYTGVFVQAGVPALYATVAANTNFKVSYIQYGLGTGFQITKAARFLFNVSLGDVERSGHYTDSLKNQFPVRVKSNLTRVSASLEIFLSKEIGIQIGTIFNHLKTRYYIDNMATNLAAFESGDEVFSTIKPPYLIVNTYSPTTDSNVKTWIGLQVSVLYHIKF